MPKLLYNIILLCIVLFSLQSHAQLSNTGLVLYLPMNGNAGDSSGNNYHGFAGGLVPAPDAGGNPNGALFFDLGGRIQINNPFLLRGVHEELTVLVKLYFDSLPFHPDYFFSPYYFFFNWFYETTVPVVHDKIHLRLYVKTDEFLFPPPLHRIWGGGCAFWQSVCGTDGLLHSYLRDSARVINKWFTYAFVFNRGRITQYYNCNKMNDYLTTFSSFRPCETDSANPMKIYIGNMLPPLPGNTRRNFTGRMDELRIYKRALNEEEIKAYAGNLCTPEIDPLIDVKKKPCSNNVFTISDRSNTNGATVTGRKWRITRDNFVLNDSASFEYTCTRTGNYTVYLDVEDSDGFHYLKEITFLVGTIDPPGNFIQSERPVFYLCGDQKSVQVKLTGAASYHWSPCTYLSDCDSSTVTITPQADQVYKITGRTALGCMDSITIAVKKSTDSGEVLVPTVFSPNNDGVNDVFGISQSSSLPVNSALEVYNRWGALVFKTNNPRLGWTGIFSNKPQPAGVYIWQLKYRGGAGCPEIRKKGTVLLVR